MCSLEARPALRPPGFRAHQNLMKICTLKTE
nr:MAG TPA_asm: hypothetical protein [Caudoviricetes sp.]